MIRRICFFMETTKNIESFCFICYRHIYFDIVLGNTEAVSRLHSIAKQEQEMWHTMKQFIHIVQSSACTGWANSATPF